MRRAILWFVALAIASVLAQQSRPASDPQVVEAARTIPVIGNGDVTTPEAAVHMRSETGCAGVSVRTQVLMQTGVPPPEPGIEDRVRVMSRHPVPLPLAAGSVPPIYTKGASLAYLRSRVLMRAHGLRHTVPTRGVLGLAR